jgi:hypothetical protein
MTPIVVQGRLISPTHIELSQAVVVSDPAVEIEIRPLPQPHNASIKNLLEAMAAFPSRNRSKEDIDRQIQEERDGWEHRR